MWNVSQFIRTGVFFEAALISIERERKQERHKYVDFFQKFTHKNSFVDEKSPNCTVVNILLGFFRILFLCFFLHFWLSSVGGCNGFRRLISAQRAPFSWLFGSFHVPRKMKHINRQIWHTPQSTLKGKKSFFFRQDEPRPISHRFSPLQKWKSPPLKRGIHKKHKKKIHTNGGVATLFKSDFHSWLKLHCFAEARYHHSLHLLKDIHRVR